MLKVELQNQRWYKKLLSIKEKYGRLFYVQRFLDFPQEWILFDSEKFYQFINEYQTVNHREIMEDEIVVDIDVDSETLPKEQVKEKARIVLMEIREKAIHNNFSFEWYDSGGDGFHLHFIFPELLRIPNKEVRDRLKLHFLRWLGWGYLQHKDDEAHVCTVNKTLIQIEGARHRKGGIKRIDTKLSNVILGENKIPQFIYDRYEEEEKEWKIFMEKRKEEPQTFLVKIFESPNFLSKNDGRDRAAFCLAAYYCRTFGPEEAEKRLLKWNKNILDNYHNDKLLQAKIKTVAKSGRLPYRYAVDLLVDLGYEIEK